MSITMNRQLSEKETIILDVVREYLNENRVFIIQELVPFINNRFQKISININDQGIKNTLKSLVKKKLLVEGSKLSRDAILDHETRREIFEFIQDNPGTYFHKILKVLGLNNYVVVWHIDMLEKFRFIQRTQFDNRYLYYESTLSFSQVKKQYYSRKRRSRQILAYIRNNNVGITKTHIAENLNMHFNTVEKYLDALESLNMIAVEKIDNKMLYFPK